MIISYTILINSMQFYIFRLKREKKKERMINLTSIFDEVYSYTQTLEITLKYIGINKEEKDTILDTFYI